MCKISEKQPSVLSNLLLPRSSLLSNSRNDMISHFVSIGVPTWSHWLPFSSTPNLSVHYINVLDVTVTCNIIPRNQDLDFDPFEKVGLSCAALHIHNNFASLSTFGWSTKSPNFFSQSSDMQLILKCSPYMVIISVHYDREISSVRGCFFISHCSCSS